MSRFLARWYRDNKDPLDFEVHEADNRILNFSHLGGRSLELKREIEADLYGKVILAMVNYRNRANNVIMVKTPVEVYVKCED